MSDCYALKVAADYSPDPKEPVFDSLMRQYEQVIVRSIITSFGLDFLVQDQHGGDVDTIHNVRQIGKDEQMTYKNKQNAENYENRGTYDSSTYHNDSRYRAKRQEAQQQKEAGTLKDAYTGKTIGKDEGTDLDHTISAKEIHEDRGRVLAGLKGEDLANSDSNLNSTNAHTNRTKKEKSMDEFLEKNGDEYPEESKAKMRQKDKKARQDYERKVATAYYTSPAFAKDVALAAGKVGAQMGARQVLGVVFTEVWFSVKNQLSTLGSPLDMGDALRAVGDGLKQGFVRAKEKYHELLERFQEGAIAGALASLSTTLCNIFFTTAKSAVRVIRQSWASLVEAFKVLFINPDRLSFGEQLRSMAKILSVGASVVVGGLVGEKIGAAVRMLPLDLGTIVQTFCSSLISGIMSCTLLYFFDRSALVNQLIQSLDQTVFAAMDRAVDYYRQQADALEAYAAQLMQLDLKKFKEEVSLFSSFTAELTDAKDEVELNIALKGIYQKAGISIPWGDRSFDSFMRDKSAVLVFE